MSRAGYLAVRALVQMPSQLDCRPQSLILWRLAGSKVQLMCPDASAHMRVHGMGRRGGSPAQRGACSRLSVPERRCRYAVLVDGAERKGGSLFEDFEPAINPAEEVDDPEDSKPSTWVDTPKCAAFLKCVFSGSVGASAAQSGPAERRSACRQLVAFCWVSRTAVRSCHACMAGAHCMRRMPA